MKKILVSTIAVFITLVGMFYTYTYCNGPKIIEGVVSKAIDDKGKPIESATEFSPEDTVYFSAKGNRFWIKKAQVVWYKGEIATANRFLVQEDIAINKKGYFCSELLIPEGLEEGHYAVSIYVEGSDIMETKTEFDIKNKDR